MKISRRKFTRNSVLVAAAFLVTSMATGAATRANAAVRVVATIPELAAISKEVGGDNVSVISIAKSNRDPHNIEPRPSDVTRVANADLIVRTGMQLEMWMDSLARATGNASLMGNSGARVVNAGVGVRRLEVPTGQIDGRSGDIHADGNPHFYYDPIYAKFIARNILRGLIRVDAKNANEYRANYVRFNNAIDARMRTWTAQLAPFRGRGVVTYHKNYAYFMRRFGLRNYGNLEPKPGIPPSARHINTLIANMKRDNVRSVVIENIYSTRFADLIRRQSGAKVVIAPHSVGSLGTTNYFNFMDKLVASFREALS